MYDNQVMVGVSCICRRSRQEGYSCRYSRNKYLSLAAKELIYVTLISVLCEDINLTANALGDIYTRTHMDIQLGHPVETSCIRRQINNEEPPQK